MILYEVQRTPVGLRPAAKAETSDPPAFPHTVRCPDCRGDLYWDKMCGNCTQCGRSMAMLHRQLIDSLGSVDQATRLILEWPDRFVESVDAWLLALAAGSTLPPDALSEIQLRGLLDANHHTTSLGRRLTHCLLMREWQAGDEQFQEFMDAASLGPNARVLDIGCSIGQSLATLAPYLPAESIGVDVDLEVLAFACRLAQPSGQQIGFIHATGHSLPFQDHSFTHVICRNALTYMHHERALTEMARVLKPGGYMYLRFENAWYDLLRLRGTAGLREFGCRVRDLHLGLLNALCGRQPTPGRRWSGGRAFATTRRLRTILGRLDCQVARIEASIRCPTCFRRATQTSLLAQKA